MTDPTPDYDQSEIERLTAEVKHWKDHAEEAGAGFSRVCEDAARITANNVRLRGEIDRLANLAAEHLNCSGCPTPWWLNNWLLAVAANTPAPTGREADDA